MAASLPDGSRVRRESHARFCERLEVKSLRPTHHRSHYVRDVTFGEDRCRTRIKPLHFARFRSFAINILRANGVENIARELYVNALNFNNPLAYRFS